MSNLHGKIFLLAFLNVFIFNSYSQEFVTDIDRNTYFWTSTEYSSTAAWMRMTGANMKNVNRSTAPKEYAFSIRCVKN